MVFVQEARSQEGYQLASPGPDLTSRQGVAAAKYAAGNRATRTMIVGMMYISVWSSECFDVETEVRHRAGNLEQNGSLRIIDLLIRRRSSLSGNVLFLFTLAAASFTPT